MGKKILGGDNQGGYTSGLGAGKSAPSGKTMKYKDTGGMNKDIIGGGLKPMSDGYKGRVLYGGNSRTGRKEGTGNLT